MKTLIFEGKVLKVGLIQVCSKFTKKAYHACFSPVRFKTVKDDRLPNSNWVKVKNIQSGICGTDLTFYTCKQGPSTALYPMPCSDVTYLGHETVGIVEQIGEDVSNLKVGDRVILHEYMSCCDIKNIDRCDNCKNGDYAICENYGVDSTISQTLGAGMGDYYYAHKNQLLKIDDNISNDQAVLIEPFAVSLHAVLKHIPNPGEKVLVVGAGMIGLGIIQMLKIFQPNCKVYVMERDVVKQQFALKLGADEIVKGNAYEAVAKCTDAKLYKKGNNIMLIGGFDSIFDTVGKGSLLNDTLRWVKARGTIVKVGYQMTKTKFDETPLWWQEVNIIGVDSHGMENYNGKKQSSFEMVIDLMNQNKLITNGFITHHFKLTDYKKAFKLLIERTEPAIKVVLDCEV